MTALILENLQIDYCIGGAMEVPNSDEVIAKAVQLMEQHDWVIAAIDWHPANHQSFAATHPWRRFGQLIEIEGIPMELGPIHCVQNTFGAAFPKAIDQQKIHKIIQKGTTVSVDDDSCFFDAGKKRATGLDTFLKEKGIKELSIIGLNFKRSVIASTLDAISLGYKVNIVKEACGQQEGVDRDQLFSQLAAAGAIIS